MMTPSGKVFDQQLAYPSKEKHLIIICGHYEDFDERIRTIVVWKLVLVIIFNWWELPSMVITDAIVRLIDGVINQESLATESFNDNLLDYPNYTQPRDFRGLTVPHVLLSGNHQKIEEWRQNERIKRTKEKRPDLLEK